MNVRDWKTNVRLLLDADRVRGESPAGVGNAPRAESMVGKPTGRQRDVGLRTHLEVDVDGELQWWDEELLTVVSRSS